MRPLFVLLLLPFILTAQADARPGMAKGQASPIIPKSEGPAAKVNGKAISYRYLVGRMMQRARWLSFHRNFTESMIKSLRKKTLTSLIEEELLYQHAKTLKMVPSNKEIKEAKAKEVKRGGGARKMSQKLQSWHMSWKGYWQDLKKRMSATRVLEKLVVIPSMVKEAEVKANYKANPGRFKRPPEVKLRQVLMALRPEQSPKEVEAARSKARSVAAALRGGANFDQLMKKMARGRGHSSDIRGGKAGWVHKGRLLPEVEKVAFKIKIGKVSEPIKTYQGFVIVIVDARRPERQLTYEEVAPKLKQRILDERLEKRKKELLDKLRAKATITRRY